MEIDGPLVIHGTMGEYALWTAIWNGVLVILGLGIGWMNLNHSTGISIGL